MAARAEPMAKVMEMVRLTLMPMSCAAPLSSDTARMALPVLVFPVNQVRTSMIATPHRMVTMLMLLISSFPSSRLMLPIFTMEGNWTGLGPKINWAAFCRK